MFLLAERDACLNNFDRVVIKQLDYCNAFVRSCYLIETDTEPCRVELISYCTPVCAIEYDNNGVTVLEVAPAATCSATTRKHVGRFLNSYGPIWTYLVCKSALNAGIETPYVCIDEHLNIGPCVDYSHLFNVRYKPIKPYNNGMFIVR